MHLQGYHPITRWLHLGLILGVSLQLSSSLFMAHPDDHAGPIGDALMRFHQIDGLIVAACVLANVIWACMLRGNPAQRQVHALFSKRTWYEAKLVAQQLPQAIKGQIAFIHPNNSLSKIIEMLGLLTMLGMAITGTLIWFNNDATAEHSHAHISQTLEFIMLTHALLSKLLWCYVVGHVFMAWMHVRAGNKPFSRILPFRR